MSGIEHDNPFLKGAQIRLGGQNAQMELLREPATCYNQGTKVMTSLHMIVLMVVWAVTVLGTFAAGWFLAIGPPC